MILLTFKADITIFALLACAPTIVKIVTDPIAWDGCLRCVPCGGPRGLVWTRLEAQEDVATWIFAPPGHGIVLAFKNACGHEGIVVLAEGVEFV